MINKYNLKVGDRVRVLDNFNMTALGKVGIILDKSNEGFVVGFFCEGVESNCYHSNYTHRYHDLKATWWYTYSGVEPAREYTQNKFK